MPYSTCVRCDDCDGFPCLVHAKSDAEVISVRPALEHDNVTLLTGAQAVKLNTDAGGKAVTEVVVERDGETETYTADIVVVSCGAANSARLLLASATDKHPNGLANGSDQVGRNYMFHNSQAVLALSKEPNPTIFQKTLGLNDYLLRGRRVRLSRWGTSRWSASRRRRCSGARSQGRRSLRPSWTLENVAAHAVDFWLSTEDLPKAENRVTLGPDGHVKLSYTLLEQRAQEAALGQARVDARRHRHAPPPPAPTPRLPEERDPGGRGRPSDRHLPVRRRPGELGAEHRLPGARARQPLRRRHELLSRASARSTRR